MESCFFPFDSMEVSAIKQGLTGTQIDEFVHRQLKLQIEYDEIRKKADKEREERVAKHPNPIVDPLRSSLPKIPPFDETVDEIDLYIDRFERLAKFYKWKEEDYSMLLGTLLRGRALKIYCSLSSDIVNNFVSLKKALLKAFHINSNVYRRKFRDSIIDTDESFVQFNCKLGQYFDKWLELANVEKNYESVRDFMIFDQMLSSCSHDLRSFLLEQSLQNSCQLAESADRYLVAHGMKKCRKSNDKIPSKPYAKPLADNITKSPKVSNSVTKSDSNVKCHHCEVGHIRPNCPVYKLNKKSDKVVPKIGVVLGREEKLHNCVTDTDGKIFDQSVEIVFDTGCNTVVCIQLLSKFFSGKVKAIVAPIRCADVIIGLIPGLKHNVDAGLSLINGDEFVSDRNVNVNVVTRAKAKDKVKERPMSSNLESLDKEYGLNSDEFSEYQKECPSLASIRKLLDNEESVTLKCRTVKYVNIGDLIYRKCLESSKPEDVGKLQLVVPVQYRNIIMKLAHESLLAGHFSSRKTIDKIMQKFYWPRASLDIHRFCKSCHSCQKFSSKPKKVPLVPMPIVNEPFSRIAIDLIGPITPCTKKGHKYILTVIDMATRYPEAVALRNIDTVSVAKALMEIFCRVGIPKEILSDRGTQFKSHLMSEINKLLCIKAIYTSSYHASCNGMVEPLQAEVQPVIAITDNNCCELTSREEKTGNYNFCESLSSDKINDLEGLLKSFTDVMSDTPGRTKTISHNIKLQSDEPIRAKNYPIPLSLLDEFNKEVDRMIDMDIIQPSTSDYCSPVVIVRKPNGSIRLCVDFRALNKYSEFDAEPMPSINDDLHKMNGAKYFTELDLCKGYWQVPLDPRAMKFTAFSTNKSWSNHLNHIKLVLSRLRDHGLTAGPDKCFFAFNEIKYLGYKLGNNCLSPIRSRVDDIVNMPVPTTKKDLRSFMGTLGYYNRFIPNFSILSAPINDLLKKTCSNKLNWSDNQLECFNDLKAHLLKSPILMLPDVEKKFYLRTDASYHGLGAVILQDHDGVFKPVCYAGRKLNKSELNYSTIEKELFAIVWGIERFKEFLYGKEFVLQTDHAPLKYLSSMKNKNDRLMRWALSLQPYSFFIEYIRGSDNVCSDMISRCI
ncbi:uncharacterized protein [Palaemon carinicauda]|uniref:uncharacterized protein n=1 Tax=Palaemon carinicauda TaxID=392227 RepID=UPI0035B68741